MQSSPCAKELGVFTTSHTSRRLPEMTLIYLWLLSVPSLLVMTLGADMMTYAVHRSSTPPPGGVQVCLRAVARTS